MYKTYYICYIEDYSFDGYCKKLCEVENFSSARDYLWSIKDNYVGQPISLYVKFQGREIYSIDCLDGEVIDLCL